MAFSRSELSLMAYTGADGGHHLYFYSNSASDTVTAANFFDDAADELNVGDLIYDVDGAIHYNVTAITDGAVTVAANYTAPV